MPSFKSLIGIPIFIMASGLQFDCHGYLASLEKYSLPEHPAFERIVCPHYLAECLVYFALAVLGAPKGVVINWTLWTALVFVGINLGVASKMNRDWYEKKFGKEALKREYAASLPVAAADLFLVRYNMIPAVF
jgi:3-oxo-5-alpha-steroid 4-dehydrogenase 3